MKKRNNNQFALLVQSRVSSKRLSNKILRKINNISIIDYFINRAFKLNVSKIIFLIAKEKNYFLIEKKIKKNKKIKYFLGPKHNVLKRTYLAAKKYNVKNIVRITSDCPIFDPSLVNKGINTFKIKKPDYLSNNLIKSWPHGLDYEIFSFESLKYAFTNASKKYDLEHVTPFIRRSKRIKKINILNKPKIYKNFRWTLDTKKDFIFFQTLFKKKPDLLRNFKWKNIYNFLKKNDYIRKINLF